MYIHKFYVLFIVFCFSSLIEAHGQSILPDLENSQEIAIDSVVDSILIELAGEHSSILKDAIERCEKCYVPNLTEISLLLISRADNFESKFALIHLKSLKLDGGASELLSEILHANHDILWNEYLKSDPKELHLWCVEKFKNVRNVTMKFMPDVKVEDVCWDIDKIKNDLIRYRKN